MENKQLFICNRAKECIIKCLRKIPHKQSLGCDNGVCFFKYEVKCVPYKKSKKIVKRYSLKELYNLWIEWTEKYNIRVQKFYEEYGLPRSFIVWLEEREKSLNEPISQ